MITCNLNFSIKLVTQIILYGLLVLGSVLFFIKIIVDYIITSPSTWSHVTNNMLYGIGDEFIPAFGMYLHFIFGGLILLLALVQILPFIRKKRYIIIHKIVGNIYVISCILVGIGGNIFIYSNGTSGGINMDIAFSVYGWLLTIFAIITYIQIRYNNIESHRNWALRLWSLGIASLVYRVIYMFLSLCTYHTHSALDFFRPLDMVIDWLFFTIPLVCAELYIYMTYKRNNIYNRNDEELVLLT